MSSGAVSHRALEVGRDASQPVARLERKPRHWILAGVIAAAALYFVAAPKPVHPPVARITADDDGLSQSVTLWQAGRFQEAAGAAKAYLAIHRDSAFAYNNLAISYLKLGLWDLAVRNAQEAIRLKPDFQLARNNLAWIQAERDKAKAQAASWPQTPAALLSLSLADYQLGKFAECIDAAQQAVNLRPGFAEAFNNIGACYAAMKLWDEAIEAEIQALRFKPDFALARNNLSWALNMKTGGASGKK